MVFGLIGAVFNSFLFFNDKRFLLTVNGKVIIGSSFVDYGIKTAARARLVGLVLGPSNSFQAIFRSWHFFYARTPNPKEEEGQAVHTPGLPSPYGQVSLVKRNPTQLSLLGS